MFNIEELFINIQKHLARVEVGAKVLNVLLIEHIYLINYLIVQEEKLFFSWFVELDGSHY